MRKFAIMIAIVLVGGGASAYWYTRTGPVQSAGSSKDHICKHLLPGDKCPFCTPSLFQKMGECIEHGVPEALCWKCNRKLVQAFEIEKDWCREHNYPESMCPICRGSVGKAEANHIEKSEVDVGELNAHDGATQGTVTALVPEVRRTLRPPNATCKNTDSLIRFASAETPAQAGLAYATVNEEPLVRTITRNAEIAYDGTHYARLSSRAPGVVAEVRKDVGARVARGDVLAVVDSVELGTAKAEFLRNVEMVKLAKRSFEREQELLSKGVGVQSNHNTAETKLAESRIVLEGTRQRLRNLGLKPDQIETVENAGDTSSLLELAAPFDGLICERSAVIGELAESNAALFTIADTETMWAMIDLRSSDLVAVREGQGVSVTVDGLNGETFGGRLTWISTQLDEKTRTLKARAELKNRDGLLRAAMFGRARIVTRAGDPALMVPQAAVQWDGCCNVAFVRVDEERPTFEPRKVRLGYATDEKYEVLAGLWPGDVVVTQGSFLLKTQILKGSIGAGCCDAAVEELAK